jgi:hypothetical protein
LALKKAMALAHRFSILGSYLAMLLFNYNYWSYSVEN